MLAHKKTFLSYIGTAPFGCAVVLWSLLLCYVRRDGKTCSAHSLARTAHHCGPGEPLAGILAGVLAWPWMLAIGSGGNKFIELLAEAHELRVRTGKDWEVLAGISAGALLCGLISMIPLNDAKAFEKDLTRAREKFIHSSKSSPFRPWVPLGLLPRRCSP